MGSLLHDPPQTEIQSPCGPAWSRHSARKELSHRHYHSTYQVTLAGADDARVATHLAWTELQLRKPLFNGGLNHSVFAVSSFASAAECDGLITAAHKVAALYERKELQCLERVPIAASSAALRIHSRLVKRLFLFIESEMPVMDWDDTHLNAPGVAESFVRLKQE